MDEQPKLCLIKRLEASGIRKVHSCVTHVLGQTNSEEGKKELHICRE